MWLWLIIKLVRGIICWLRALGCPYTAFKTTIVTICKHSTTFGFLMLSILGCRMLGVVCWLFMLGTIGYCVTVHTVTATIRRHPFRSLLFTAVVHPIEKIY